MAKVCVCIPTRNRPNFVQQALASVLVQTADDLRVLVSDDASTPEAAAAVRTHVEGLADPRVGYHYHADNLREFDHGRFLFRQCREEFFAILHDDDRWDAKESSRPRDALGVIPGRVRDDAACAFRLVE